MKNILIKPFITDTLDLSHSIFLKYNYPARYKTNSHNSYSFFGNKSTLKETIQATIGESIEREHLYNNSDNRKLNAFNIVNGDLMEVELKDFLLNLNLKSLQNHYPLYSDTCGVATHLKSNQAIEGAFYEFIERQSLILTWVSQMPGKAISLEYIKHYMKLKDFEGYQFYINDISLWKMFKVIIVIGFNNDKKRFTVGCSAHKILNQAIEGAMSEASIIAHFYEAEDYSNSKNIKTQQMKDSNSYANYFYSLTFEELKSKYAFIINNDKFIEFDSSNEKLSKDDIKNLGIDIFCTLIPNNNNKQFKTVKVFSPDAFPHMDTATIDPSNYKITELSKLRAFPNIYQPIPFP